MQQLTTGAYARLHHLLTQGLHSHTIGNLTVSMTPGQTFTIADPLQEWLPPTSVKLAS